MHLAFKCSKSLLIVAALAGSLAASDNGKSSSPTGLAAIEIDGATFSLADLQRKSSGALFQARNALFEAQRKAADEFVNDYLLEREAKKENLTVEQLLERHAYTFKEPSEEALRVYYDGLDTTEPFDTVREKIRDVIRQRRITKAKTAYVKSLRSQANVTIRLSAPRAQFTAENTPVRGSSSAAVTVIEFADYECPYCQQIQPAIAKLEADYKGKIAFAYKDVPLPMHAHAQKAAEAAHCAGDQGKYWEYHDLLFASKQYDVPQLKEHARTLKLDGKAFDQCLDSGAQAERIKASVAEAQSIGLPGTPGFFVNGRFINGAVDYQTLQQVIDEELRAASSSMAEAQKQVNETAKKQN